ncbi:hypothetical protein D3C87_2132470 [compost metagenome]
MSGGEFTFLRLCQQPQQIIMQPHLTQGFDLNANYPLLRLPAFKQQCQRRLT